jgi:DNA-directed RNA polymerase subunit H
MAKKKKDTTSSKTTKKSKTNSKSKTKTKVKPKKPLKTRRKRKIERNFKVEEHVLVPKHTKLTNEEKEKLFEKYNITTRELPKILITDPAIQKLDPKIGDVIRIERKSLTAGNSIFYRGVTNE